MNNFTHNDLISIAERWLLRKNCGFVFKELVTYTYEIPDVIGFKQNRTILIECKVSRNDFLNDLKKKFRVNPNLGMGTYRFYICPKDLIKVNELPDKWGLLYVSDSGKVFQQIGPKGNIWSRNYEWMFEKNIESERMLMYSALRRLHLQGVMNLIYEKYGKKNYHYKIHYKK